MEGYGDSVDLYTKAIDSAGIASKKFELYQQGTQAQLDKLKSSIESIWMGMFNSNGINTVISSLNGVTNAFKTITDNVGALAPIFGIAGISILAFNGGLKSIMTTGTATIAVLRGIPSGLTSMDSALAASTLKARLFSMTVNGTGIALKGLRTAIVSTTTFVAGAIFPIAAFMAVGFAIQKVTETIMKQREEAKKMKQEQDDIVKKYSTHADQIDKLASEYENLSGKVKNGQLDEHSEAYVSNMNELGKLMPSLVKTTDEHGNSILRSVDAVKQELEYAKQLKENFAQMTVANFEKDLDKQSSKVDDILAKIEGFKNDKKPIVTGKVATPVSQGDKLYADRQIIGQERELQLLLAQSGTYLNEKAKAIMEVEGLTNKLSESSQKLIEKYINESVASKKTVADGNDFKQFLSDTTNNAVNLAQSLSKLPEALNGMFSTKEIKKFSDDQLNTLKSIKENLDNGGSGWEHYKKALTDAGFSSKEADSILKQFTESLKQNSDASEDATLQQQKLKDALDAADKSYKDSMSNIQSLNGIINELNDAHSISADSISFLASKYPELLNYIGNETALRQNVMSVIETEKNVAIDALNQKLSTSTQYFNKLVSANQQYFNGLASYYNVDLKNVGTVAQLKYQIETKLIEKLGDAWASYYDATAMQFTAAGKSMLQGMGYAEAVASPQLKAISEYESRMKSLANTMRGFSVKSGYSAGISTAGLQKVGGSGSKGSKGSGGSSSDKEKGQSAFEKYLDQMDARIAESEARAEALDRTSTAYQNEINTQWKLQTDKAKKYQAEIARLTKSQGANSEEVLKLRESYAGLQKEIADLNWEFYDAEIQRYSDKVSDLSDEIEYSKKVMELHSDSFAINQIETEKQISLYEDQMKLLDQERSTMERAIKNGYLNAAQKKEMQERLDALNKEYIDYEINIKNATDALEEQRQAEKDQIKQKADDFIDAYKAYYEKRKELDQKALDDELSAYEKMVNEKIALIDKEEQARDDSRELANKQKEISDIQAQINALSGDSSQAGRVSELRKQLAEKQSDLGEYVHDKEVEQRKDALNSELEQKRSQIEEEKKLMDEHYENLLNDERKFAEMREQIMNGNVLYFQSMLALFTQDVQNNMGEIGKSISENLIDKLAEASDGLSDAKQEFDNMSKVYSGSDMNVSGTDTAKEDKVTIQEDTPLLKKTANGYEYSGTTLKKGSTYKAYGVNSKDGVYLVGGNGYVTADPKFTKYQRFDTGGYTKNGEGFAMLHEKEIVLNKMDTANFLKAVDITRQIASMLPKFSIPKIIPNNVANQHQTINMNINIEHMNGTKQGVNDFFKDINNALRSKGGMLFT